MWGNFILLCILCSTTSGDIYTSMVSLEQGLEAEGIFLEIMKNYVNQQENRLSSLKLLAAKYEKELNLAFRKSEDYLANPINAYFTTKRIFSGWKYFENFFNENASQNTQANIKTIKTMIEVPTAEDMIGAANSLIRIQDFYGLSTSTLLANNLNGIQSYANLTGRDCFEFGKQSFKFENYNATIEWMLEALERFKQEGILTDTLKMLAYYYLAYSSFHLGDIQNALTFSQQQLTIDPTNMEILKQIVYVKDIKLKNQQKQIEGKKEMSFKEIHVALCRGINLLPSKFISKHKCRYKRDSPFLKIAPLKVEEVNIDPQIVLFREVITDEEIELLKNLATNKLVKAGVLSRKSADRNAEIMSLRTSLRTGKLGWLTDEEDETVARLSRRIEDMTGLTTSTAEYLQVFNYGMGGHYAPHYDSLINFDEKTFGFNLINKRIATVVFYLNEVTQGGRTVFPLLNLTIEPEKRSAVFWFNLNTDGQSDLRSLHAGCPVLVGTKWIANKWLHEEGQEFRRPCSLILSDQKQFYKKIFNLTARNYKYIFSPEC